jgi:hypothetical protein
VYINSTVPQCAEDALACIKETWSVDMQDVDRTEHTDPAYQASAKKTCMSTKSMTWFSDTCVIFNLDSPHILNDMKTVFVVGVREGWLSKIKILITHNPAPSRSWWLRLRSVFKK